MKRIALLLLALLLTVGCVSAAAPMAVIVRTTSSATPSPEPGSTQAPEAAGEPEAVEAPASYVPEPLAYYRFYDQSEWENLASAVMFTFDLDQDGTAEDISFVLDREEWTTTIFWGDSSVVLEESDQLVEAAILDLDGESPFYNLLVVVDYDSDSYVTIELHPENGQLVKGTVIQGSWEWADNALWFYERTDFLGTDFGQRTYGKDALVPDSEWLTMCSIPSAEELETEMEDLIGFGALLHTVEPVPCTVDGQPDLLPADTYLYRLRFRAEDDLTEVCTVDGVVAQIACTVGEDGWPYLIDGQDVEHYFDNLFFAD